MNPACLKVDGTDCQLAFSRLCLKGFMPAHGYGQFCGRTGTKFPE